MHVFCLGQIASFAEEVARIYHGGIRMSLVIDNLVANFVNEIPLERTMEFCAALQTLVDRLGMSDLVRILVESTVSPFTRDELAPVTTAAADALSEDDYENVLRFSGRWLDPTAAAGRLARYLEVTTLSEKYLAEVIDGVHLTQRRGSSTLSFRSFPGGSARIQTGRCGFLRNSRGKLIPRLLTTGNIRQYRINYAPLSLERLWEMVPAALPATVKFNDLAGGPTACCQTAASSMPG
jgi:hypothetical protein